MTDIEFRCSEIGTDYLECEEKGLAQPSVDEFLDYINAVKEMEKETPPLQFPKYWYKREIEAAKEIIKKLQV